MYFKVVEREENAKDDLRELPPWAVSGMIVRVMCTREALRNGSDLSALKTLRD